MPGFDRTGPRGMGSMTGWGRGLCATGNPPQSVNERKENIEEGATGAPATVPAAGYGLGRGGMPRGCGRGFGGGRNRGFSAAGRGFGGGGRGRGRF